MHPRRHTPPPLPPGWIKFHAASTSIAAGVVTALMGVALLYNLYTHRKWGEYLLQDEQADKVRHDVNGREAVIPDVT